MSSIIKSSDEIVGLVNQRQIIIDDYFALGELMMIFAPSKTGKTYNALTLAVAMAYGGDFYGDPILYNYNVMYIDGELGESAIGKRLNDIRRAKNIETLPNLWTLCSDSIEGQQLPNLSYEQNQKWITDILVNSGIQILFLDNYNTLFDDQGDMFSCWSRTVKWFRQLKNLGIAIILIHHTNKQGEQPAGVVKMEQQMDCVIGIRKSPLARSLETLIEVHFYQLRHSKDQPTKLARLYNGTLEHLDYKSILEDRIREDFSEWGLSYVLNKYDVPSWKIREVCDIKEESKGRKSINTFEKILNNKNGLFI